jgi:archaemetzincin
MNGLHLLAVGEVPRDLLEDLSQRFEDHWQVPCRILSAVLGADFALHAQRQQFHSTPILARMERELQPDTWRLLGITTADLYVPVLTFVFGEAQLTGRCALVSTHRLGQEFFGLPPDHALFHERVLKESVHELGHTFGLMHCSDHACVMAASHGVEWIDLKGATFCGACAPAAAAALRAVEEKRNSFR